MIQDDSIHMQNIMFPTECFSGQLSFSSERNLVKLTGKSICIYGDFLE